MLQLLFFTALILQSSLTYAEPEESEQEVTRDVLNNELDEDPELSKIFYQGPKDWVDMFALPGGGLYPSFASAMMTQATTNSNKSYEEQLKEIQDTANKIAESIKSEMATVIDFAMTCKKFNERNNNTETGKTKRSVESPMDSTQLVFRLLKHIKSNNEYQNIAIEKMMTAQEIADKYGIPFDPDVEVLSDLAVAANEQAQEMTNILKDAVDMKNATTDKIEFVPLDEPQQTPIEDSPYYVYSLHQENPFAPYEYAPTPIKTQPHHHHHETHNHFETQIPAPHQCNPVTPKPNFYDSMMAVTPAQDMYPICLEPVTTTTTIVFPIDDIIEPEPELVGEEYEETVTSKMMVDHEEPGMSTVNHVMTYTLSEKAHFRTPQIEQLPQQMQYSFFLM